MLGDGLHLEQALYNLVQNAMKYSPLGGTTTVTARAVGPAVEICVSDERLGIPAAVVAQVFERFYRASNVALGHVAGLGLGLHRVKEVVTQHGGTVEVESVEGQGSTFRMNLPLLE